MTQQHELPKEVDLALGKEASMSAVSICVALTHIRKYDFVRFGYFYSAMSMYATGIERLLKLIIIYDYRINNNDQFPDNNYLKKYSHKIVDLVETVKEYKNKYSMNKIEDIFVDDIYNKIIKVISDFAIQARYYNLDYLTGKNQIEKEPLKRWNAEINSIIVKRHYRLNAKRLAYKKIIGQQMDEISSVMFENEDGNSINSMEHFFIEGDTVNIKQKYSVYYLYNIVRFFSRILGDFEYRENFYPYLREYFALFSVRDKQWIIRRKVWDIFSVS
jgi:hypothetical protein